MTELINGKRQEQVRNALCICTNGGCTKYKCAYEEDGDCSGSVMRDALALIKHLEAERDAALAKVPKWISVEERLPENGNDVLCWYEYYRYGDYNRMYQTYGIGCCWNGTWCGDVSSGSRAKVLYWMPLPEPPKEASE